MDNYPPQFPSFETNDYADRFLAKRKRSSGGSRTTLARRDGNKCYYCRNEFPIDQLTRDHKLPVSRGGKSEFHNLVLACGKCNTLKGSLTAEEFWEFKRLLELRLGNKR